MFKKIYIDNEEIDYFIVNTRGKIIEAGEGALDTFEETYVCLDSLKVGSPVEVSFNKVEHRKSGKTPVWTETNSNVLRIEEIKPINK